MKTVKLSQPDMIDDKHYNAGDVVLLSNVRAENLVGLGHAEHSDGGDVANPDVNPLADSIDPLPPVAMPVDPPDALAPKVADNPGLVDLVEATGKQSEIGADGTTAEVSPAETTPASNPSVQTATKRGGNRSASNLNGKAE